LVVHVVLIDGFTDDLCLLTQGKVEGLACELGQERDSSINVVADSFNKFGSLSLNNLRFLLVAGIEGKIYKGFWVLNHLFELRLGCSQES
jgi:hypothetical protein